MGTNKIHIQSGSLKGRRIVFPDRPGLRPATGEMRATLFNWLRPIYGKTVLDAFCGSGALSLEAISQGAKEVYAFEIDESACQHINQTTSQFPPIPFKLINGDFRQHWSKKSDYDLIFLDPPYESTLLNEALFFLSDKISPESLVFAHYPTHNQPALTDWHVVKQKKRNNRHYVLLKSTKKIEKKEQL